MIDLYCERCGPGLLAEPVNAFTNLSFLIAAWATWNMARRSNALDVGIGSLIALAVAIGVGSAMFHTFATRWAWWLDILPILLFQLVFLWLYLRRIVRIGPLVGFVSLAGYFATTLFARRLDGVLNGSLVYAPAFLVLIGLGIHHLRHRGPERFLLLGAAGVFSVSLFFRSIDQALCPWFPLGTHFLWHLLNGVLLYLSMRALIMHARSNRNSMSHAIS